MKHNKKGFTLIELIVVLAILAIVAAIAVPTAFGSIEKARNAADKATIDSINSAIRVHSSLLYVGENSVNENLIKTAIEQSGINIDVLPQSTLTGVMFYFVPATENQCAYFIYDKGGFPFTNANGNNIRWLLDAAIAGQTEAGHKLDTEVCIVK